MHGHPLWTVSLGKADVIRTGGLVADMGGNAYIAGDFPTKAAPYVLVGSRNSSRPGHPFVLESANPPSTNRDVFVLKVSEICASVRVQHGRLSSYSDLN